MPSDAALKVMNLVHRAVIRVSRGRLGWRVGGVRARSLTTTGRTSGRSRTVMLNGFDDGAGAIAVVASRGGDDRHPDWFLNLIKDPTASVSLEGAPPVQMRAHVAEEPERTAT
jgi:deazaflavin-dependent oxidoreductase (nitroreductase family)